MKGNFSRDNHRPEDRYSGVYQVQGGMVTDADLGEQAKIARSRTDNLGHDTAGSGVPEEGGVVSLSGGVPSLVEGVVYAGGVRGEVRAVRPLAANPLALYTAQLDFPLVPALPNGDLIVYADVWERTISPLEDPLLTDPGLHGAETALRSRTMAQLKFAPIGQQNALGDPNGPVPRTGNGLLSVTPVDPENVSDPCDPCADVDNIQQTVTNTLFRLEVVHVFGDPQSPDRITLAWSGENASAVAPSDVNSEDFSRAGAVYEFFSYATETHLGVHENNGSVARSSFGASLAGGPAVANAPEGGDWPNVRRWGGAAELDFTANSATRVGGGSGITVSGRVVTLTVDAFTAELDFSGRAIVAGDYWLIELRPNGEPPVRVVRETPVGIIHHYCPLFRLDNRTIVTLSDEENRRLSFPALADIPASHVSIVNNCTKLYDDAKNVQEALDNLCDIEAADISFDPSDCPRLFDSTDNVQDALINLCKVDFGSDRWLRYLHDWGVICGVIPSWVRDRTNPSKVSYSKGAILDRAGKFAEVRGRTLELQKLIGTEFFLFDDLPDFAKRLRSKDVCLALAIADSGDIDVYLAPKVVAFGPEAPTFLKELEKCRKQIDKFDYKDNFSKRRVKERDALEKISFFAANRKLAAAQGLKSEEQVIARAYNDDLIERYGRFINDDAEMAKINAQVKAIDNKIKADEAVGPVKETRLLQREIAVFQLLKNTEDERLRRCICDALIPRCATLGKAPFLIPIACVEGVLENQELIITKLCTFSCRKQALTWRTIKYYFGHLGDQLRNRVETVCCPPPPDDDDDGVIPKPGFNDFGISANMIDTDYILKATDRSMRIITGRNPPTDYKVNPKVVDLGIDQARIALEGNGVEVTTTIEIEDVDAIKKLREASVGINPKDRIYDTGDVAPGDKVALIVRDGVAVDYVKVESGGGKFLYDKKPASGAKVPGEILAGAKALEERLKAARAAAATAETGLVGFEKRHKAVLEEANKAETRLETIRGTQLTLNTDVAGLTGSLETIKTERDAIRTEVVALTGTLDNIKSERDSARAEVAVLSGTLATIRTERNAMRTEIEVARSELSELAVTQKNLLAEAAVERKKLVTAIRRETPVAAVVGNNRRFMTALATSGVTNIAGLAEMPDAKLREVAAGSGITLVEARRLKKAAVNRLKAPLG